MSPFFSNRPSLFSCEEDIPVCESSRQIKIRMKIEVKGFIFLYAGYSTHKRFVLGGAGCAAPFAGNTLVSPKTLVAYLADGCSPRDKGEIGPGRQRRAGTQIHFGRVQSRLQHSLGTRLSA